MSMFPPRKNKKTFIPRKFLIAIPLIAVSGMLFSAPLLAANWKEGRILVQPRAGLSDEKLDKLLKPHGGKAIGQLRQLNIKVIEVPEQAEDAVARALSKNKDISFAEKDMEVEPTEFFPDDPMFSNAWHLPKINAASAWDIADAEGITIAILDTGVDTSHPDLQAQIVAGRNVVNQNSDVVDINGHGTIVAGIAAASTNNANGVSAVAWNAQIMPIRITNSGDGVAYWSDMANGITWAADHGADVASLSYPSTRSSSVSSAAQYMRNKGGVVVLAAGNVNEDANISDNPSIITVSATDSNDNKASWSTYGAVVDVAAPGTSILTTLRGGGYGSKSGTSVATPITAGVVALIMGANPNLSPDEVEAILEASADDPTGSDWHMYYGHGRVNAAAAVELALNSDVFVPVDNQAPQVSIFSPGAGNTVFAQVAVEVNATDDTGVAEVSLYADNELVGTDTTAPYQFSWDSSQYADGEAVTLSAYATDAAGNEGVSNNVSVTVDNQPAADDNTPPLVEISNPADGITVSRTVNIQVFASDETRLDNVELYIDNNRVSSLNTEHLSYSWNTRKANSGEHSLRAIAYDFAGNRTEKTVFVNIADKATSSKGKGKNK